MSFRLFIYYCAVCGGCAAYVGWAVGYVTEIDDPMMQAAVQGMLLGLAVALALGLIDALWNGHAAQAGRLLGRVGVAVAVGTAGGFLGGLLGQVLDSGRELLFFIVLGWVITGTLVGAAPGLFDYLRSLARREDSGGPRRKVLRGLLGGAAGGLLGALLYVPLDKGLSSVLSGKEDVTLWSPTATGFVALGLSIGLMIGLAQVILREAWLRVDAGFRPGRELLVSKGEMTIGRAESCDLGLFGDPSVDRLHARIVRHGGRYILVDAGSASGTFLNGQRVAGSVVLQTGDEIRLGRCVLRFGERRRRTAVR